MKIYKKLPKDYNFMDPCRSLAQAKTFKKGGYGGYKSSEIIIVKTGGKGDIFPYHTAVKKKSWF